MLLTVSIGESVFQLVVVTAIFIFVLFITQYATRWLSGYMKAQSYNKNLRIVETIRLSTNKYVQIIGAGSDRYFVIAVGKDEVTVLGELSADEIREDAPDLTVRAGGQRSFDEILKNLGDRLPGSKHHE